MGLVFVGLRFGTPPTYAWGSGNIGGGTFFFRVVDEMDTMDWMN